MERQTFLAQSPDAAMVQNHLAAAVRSLDMAQQCLTQPKPRAATRADFHRSLAAMLWELEAARRPDRVQKTLVADERRQLEHVAVAALGVEGHVDALRGQAVVTQLRRHA